MFKKFFTALALLGVIAIALCWWYGVLPLLALVGGGILLGGSIVELFNIIKEDSETNEERIKRAFEDAQNKIQKYAEKQGEIEPNLSSSEGWNPEQENLHIQQIIAKEKLKLKEDNNDNHVR